MSDQHIAGIEIGRGTVLPEWIDANNHMNVAYYLLAFDQGVDSLWEKFGITNDTINGTNSSTFAVESHLTWQREMVRDEDYFITSQLLAYDEKRIHQFMRMYDHAGKHLVATAEWLNIHVDLKVRRVSPWPEAIREKIAEFAGIQSDWGWPAEAGKKMHLANPIYCATANG